MNLIYTQKSGFIEVKWTRPRYIKSTRCFSWCCWVCWRQWARYSHESTEKNGFSHICLLQGIYSQWSISFVWWNEMDGKQRRCWNHCIESHHSSSGGGSSGSGEGISFNKILLLNGFTINKVRYISCTFPKADLAKFHRKLLRLSVKCKESVNLWRLPVTLLLREAEKQIRIVTLASWNSHFLTTRVPVPGVYFQAWSEMQSGSVALALYY